MGDLSRNFSINEIFGNNKPSEAQKQTAKRLAVCILQPTRNRLNHPITISSGYRSPEHNAKIGGSKTSEHTWQGSAGAVDISIFDDKERLDTMQWMINDMPFVIGQCIYYLETSHLHISIADTKQGEFMVCTSKKHHKYTRVKDASEIIALDKRLQNVS